MDLRGVGGATAGEKEKSLGDGLDAWANWVQPVGQQWEDRNP